MQLKNKRYILKTFTCRFCEKTVTQEIYASAKDKKVYCSSKCREEFCRRKHQRGRYAPKIDRPCRECGKMFNPKGFGNEGRSDITYCSEDCRKHKRDKVNAAMSDTATRFSYLKLRFAVFMRDKFTCQYCGRKSPEATLVIDHAVPKKYHTKESNKNPDSYVTSCKECNIGKADVLLEVHREKAEKIRKEAFL